MTRFFVLVITVGRVKVHFPGCVCIIEAKSLDEYFLHLWHRPLGHRSKNNVLKIQSVAEGITSIERVGYHAD